MFWIVGLFLFDWLCFSENKGFLDLDPNKGLEFGEIMVFFVLVLGK